MGPEETGLQTLGKVSIVTSRAYSTANKGMKGPFNFLSGEKVMRTSETAYNKKGTKILHECSAWVQW